MVQRRLWYGLCLGHTSSQVLCRFLSYISHHKFIDLGKQSNNLFSHFLAAESRIKVQWVCPSSERPQKVLALLFQLVGKSFKSLLRAHRMFCLFVWDLSAHHLLSRTLAGFRIRNGIESGDFRVCVQECVHGRQGCRIPFVRVHLPAGAMV